MIDLLSFPGRDLSSLLVHGALEEVDDALESQDAPALYRALQDPVLALRCLRRDNLDRYLEQLSVDREQKALVGAGRSLRARGAHAREVPRKRRGGPPGQGVALRIGSSLQKGPSAQGGGLL